MKHVLTNCMAKDCKVKIIISVNEVMIDGKEQLEPTEMLNFCPRHKDDFNNKITEIKNNFTKKELKTKIRDDIANKLINKIKKMPN